MPKNKNKPNAFYYFMVDWKTQEEKKGHTFPNGLKDVQADSKCSEAWRNLSNESKAAYKQKEKKNQLNIVKRTSLGESLDEVQKAALKEKDFVDEMREYISSIVNVAKKTSSVQKLKFYVIHANYFYSRLLDNNSSEYCPAEIAIAEFSLEEGITRAYHKIINSKIQIGYAAEATEHANNTHQIPKEPEFGESDYSIICREIYEFLKPGKINGVLPPLYTRYGEYVKCPVISVLDALTNNDRNLGDNLIVYSFEELFAILHNINIDDNSEICEFDNIIAFLKLNEDPYDYKISLRCKYHTEMPGGLYCSKSFVQRWIYILYLYSCPLFEIDLIPGFHIPIEDANTAQVVQLDSAFRRIQITEASATPSRTSAVRGATNQIKHASERTYADEQRRRSESMAKPIEIIDHSKINAASQNRSEPLERPLRPPFTRPVAACFDESSDINLDENNFPSIGRGSGGRRRMQDNKPRRSDYASRLK